MDNAILQNNINDKLNDFMIKNINIKFNRDYISKKLYNHYKSQLSFENFEIEDKSFNNKIKEFIEKYTIDSTHHKIDKSIYYIIKRLSNNLYKDSHKKEIFEIIMHNTKKSLLKEINIHNLKSYNQKNLNLLIFKKVKPSLKFLRFLNPRKKIAIKTFDFLKQPNKFKNKEMEISTVILNKISDVSFFYSKKENIIFISKSYNYSKDFLNINISVNLPLNYKCLKEIVFTKNKNICYGIIELKLEQRKKQLFNQIDKSISNKYKDYHKLITELKNKENMEFVFSFIDNKNLISNIARKLNDKIENLHNEHYKIAFKNNIGKRSLKEMYPIARNKKRKFTFFIGETGSGKTYSAFQRIKGKESGAFFAPLRLLALEGQETIDNLGYPCSLITGEEQDIKEGAMFCSSTIEMLNLTEEYDIAIIDECQLIYDEHRGWAWTQAIIGVNADEVILTGSEEALSAIEFLVDYTGEELEVIKLKKKTTLEKYSKNVNNVESIPENSAIVCFSKKRILELKNKYEKETGKHCSVIFGALSPETRKEEARRFREGETKVVFATDAIGLGLNLPIENVFFDSLQKFNGQISDIIDSSLAKQIVGRAGRYGFYNTGFYGVFGNNNTQLLDKLLKSKYPKHENNFYYKIPFVVFQEISEILNTTDSYSIIKRFVQLYDFVEPNFIKMDYSELLFKADVIEAELRKVNSDKNILTLYEKYKLIFSPLDVNNEDMKSFFCYLIKNKVLKLKDFIFEKELKSEIKSIKTLEDLNHVEYKLSKLESYNWLSFNFKDIFNIDSDKIKMEKSYLNTMVMFFLKEDGHLYKKCKSCQTFLELEDHNICEICYEDNYYH
jgi:ATP-dependent RNA helicase SUPV3L1/SUV3